MTGGGPPRRVGGRAALVALAVLAVVGYAASRLVAPSAATPGAAGAPAAGARGDAAGGDAAGGDAAGGSAAGGGVTAGDAAPGTPVAGARDSGATYLLARWAPDENPEGGVVFDRLPVATPAGADSVARAHRGYLRAVDAGSGGGTVWPYAVLLRLDADAPARRDAARAGVRLPPKPPPIR